MQNDPNSSAETFEKLRRREGEERTCAQPKPEIEPDDGRAADAPHEIPPRAWGALFKRMVAQIEGDHLPLVSAGVAFFFMLGLFPGLAALISLYGWVADPTTVTGHINQLSMVLPPQAAEIIQSQAEQLSNSDGESGWGAVLGIALALWAGSKAMKGVVVALNIAYNEREKRGLVHKQAVYLGLTLAAVIVGLISIFLIAIAPAVVGFLPISERVGSILMWLRWPILLLLGMVAVAAIYRYGPSRERAQWKWVSWGAGAATFLWLIGSALFSLYVTSFGNFNETYGSLGAVVVLMMWLYLTAFLILMGAELDSEMELQTQQDTTDGEEQPMGSRGAFVADRVVRDTH